MAAQRPRREPLSDWTVDTLREHLLQCLDDLDRVFTRRMDDADRAVTKAEAATERRFESVNEFRGALSDQQRELLPRTEYRGAHEALVERIGALADRVGALELRLTARLERGDGALSGAAGQRTEHRLETSQVIAVVAVIAAIAGPLLLLVFQHK